MQKQIILFDIDKTLFNGHSMFEKFLVPSLIEELGFDEENIIRAQKEYKKTLEKHTDFNPEEFIYFLAKSKGIDSEPIFDIFYTPEFFSESLFPEVKPILDELGENYNLGIFSEGLKSWQSKKLDNTGIKNYFEQSLVFIERRKTASAVLRSLPEKVIIIDDNVDVINNLLNFGRVRPIWINRVEKPSIEGAREIKNLTELPILLEKLNL
jgi:FMN phosphatase YigB (HAD superfamily)